MAETYLLPGNQAASGGRKAITAPGGTAPVRFHSQTEQGSCLLQMRTVQEGGSILLSPVLLVQILSCKAVSTEQQEEKC